MTYDCVLENDDWVQEVGMPVAIHIRQRGLVASPKHPRLESQISSHTRPIPNAHGARLVASPSHAPCGISFIGSFIRLPSEIEIHGRFLSVHRLALEPHRLECRLNVRMTVGCVGVHLRAKQARMDAPCRRRPVMLARVARFRAIVGAVRRHGGSWRQQHHQQGCN
jgi:hypothetical protein